MPVYFIRADENGPVKIGHGRNPASRMTDFQTAHYEALRLVRLIDGGQPEEAALHRYFSDLRIRNEWFRWSPEMLTVEPVVVSFFRDEAADRAIEAMGFDGMALLRATRGASASAARALGISRGAVAQWKVVPAERVNAVSEATGILREQLRPDLYAPRPVDQASAP